MTNVEKYALLSKSVYLFENLENWILVDKILARESKSIFNK